MSENYEANGVERLLYVTDSNTDFNKYSLIPAELNNPLFYPFDRQTSFVIGSESYTKNLQYNKTPIYSGNNTWSVSINGSANPCRFVTYMNLPDLDKWVVTKVIANITLNGDADLRFIMGFGHHNDPITLTDSPITTAIKDSVLVTQTSFEQTISIPLAQALSISQSAVESTKKDIRISIADNIGDGMTGWACQWEISIYGQPIEQYDINSVLAWTLIGSSVLIMFTAIYMTDQIDIGGYVRDRPYRRSPAKRKTTKRKR